MKKNVISLSIAALSLSFASFGLTHAQTPTPQQSYQEALAYCKSLTGDARVDCQRDAHAAYHDRNRKHTSTDKQTLEQNRIARCNRLPESQRQHCIEMMQGQHNTTIRGSVQGGGILRHTTIEIPGEPYEVTRPVSKGAEANSHTTERVITPIN